MTMSGGGGVGDDDNDNSSSSSATKKWSLLSPAAELEKEACAHMKRCEEIVRCQEEMRKLKARLNSLRREQKRYFHKATLRKAAFRVWPSLTKREKWKKSTLLAALESPHLPAVIREDKWNKNVPLHLRHDKDLMLARLARRDFPSFYRSVGTTTATGDEDDDCSAGHRHQRGLHPSFIARKKEFVLPSKLHGDKDVFLRLCEVYPSYLCLAPEALGANGEVVVDDYMNAVLSSAGWTRELLDDEDIVRALLSSSSSSSSSAPRSNNGPALVAANLHIFSPRIRENADLMLRVFEHPSTHASFMAQFPGELSDDREFCLSAAAVVPKESYLQPLLQHFSKRLRGDRRVVLAACRVNGSSLAYASAGLRRSGDVIRAARQSNPESFLFALGGRRRHGHRGDGGRGGAARDEMVASYGEMKNIFDRIAVANNNNGNNRALVDRHALAATTVQAGCFSADLKDLWDWCPPELQDKYRINVSAVAAGCLRPHEVAPRFSNSISFWLDVLAKAPHLWYNVTFLGKKGPITVFQSKWGSHLAAAAVKNCKPDNPLHGDLVRNVTMHCPQLLFDEDAMMAVARCGSASQLEETLFGPAIPTILDNPRIMAQAARRHGRVVLGHLSELAPALLNDRDVVAAGLASDPDAVHYVPGTVQVRVPDLIARAIRDSVGQYDDKNKNKHNNNYYGSSSSSSSEQQDQVLDREDILWDLFHDIDPDLWENEEVALAWAAAGGDYLHEDFPEEFERNEKLFLLIAERNHTEFWCCSEELSGNKEFMLQVVEKEGRLIREASTELQHDMDLALVAFSTTKDLVDAYDIGDCSGDEFAFLVDFAGYVRSRTRVHEGFIQLLCGMTLEQKQQQAAAAAPEQRQQRRERKNNNNNNRKQHCCCPLARLDQGCETTMAYKRRIAEYLGVPTGRELWRLRRASANLAEWGF